ncbi:MAG: RNA-binding protein [Parcubacteria group bacterium]|nr:MAG: RNA-binding protein [Parcubacteria group bacterium]
MEDKDFLETIVKAIVDKPNEVVVERTIDERGVLLTLKVNPEEMGKVIGKQGQTARALRTLLRIIGNKNNSYVNLKVYEPDKEGRPSAPRMEKPLATEDVDDLKL